MYVDDWGRGFFYDYYNCCCCCCYFYYYYYCFCCKGFAHKFTSLRRIGESRYKKNNNNNNNNCYSDNTVHSTDATDTPFTLKYNNNNNNCHGLNFSEFKKDGENIFANGCYYCCCCCCCFCCCCHSFGIGIAVTWFCCYS